MQTLNLSVILASIQFILLNVAMPTNLPSKIARSQVCANAPHTVAGTMLHGRGLASVDLKPHGSGLRPRYQFNTVLWCGENSDIYVAIETFGEVVGAAVSDLLNEAYLDTLAHLYAVGQHALIPHGSFTQTGAQNLVFSVMNSNNHQVTWSVLTVAIETLAEHMSGVGFGRAWFSIYEGLNEVGTGFIEG